MAVKRTSSTAYQPGLDEYDTACRLSEAMCEKRDEAQNVH